METHTTNIQNEVLITSQQWITNFNKGNVDFCVATYLPNAIMEVKPMGIFTGTKEIDAFWRPLMSEGATNLEYQEVSLEIIDESTVHLSARWRMNIGYGVITLEKWIKQASGLWLLAHDAFEILEQFPSHS